LGSVSLKATLLKSPAAVVFALLIVKVNVAVPFNGMLVEGLNALLIVGGAITVRVAFAVVLMPPSVELTCTLLLFTPAVVPTTLTDTAHEALAAKVPPESVTVVFPAAGENGPPQVLLAFGVAATCTPAGRLSVNASPLSVAPLLGF